jgi:hypothetical protein
LRQLMEARPGPAWPTRICPGPTVAETFDLADLHAAVQQALQRGVIGLDTVKHLLVCRVEHRPSRLDMDCYPYLPKATVETTRLGSYMRLLSGDT